MRTPAPSINPRRSRRLICAVTFNPTAIIYAPYRTVSNYITMAGGTTKTADDKEIYIIKANGSAVSRKGFKWIGSSWTAPVIRFM